MTIPSLKEYMAGATTWKKEHKGIRYTLSHHGISDYSEHGIWCFYIHLPDDIFINDQDFLCFYRKPEIIETSSGSYWVSYNYYDVPDYGFHGGITFYDCEIFIGKDGKEHKSLKIGCDYSHSWDYDRGFPDNLNSVERDAKILIDELVRNHPIKTRCAYSGQLDNPDNFYKAKNGLMIHISKKDDFLRDKWPLWMPEENETK